LNKQKTTKRLEMTLFRKAVFFAAIALTTLVNVSNHLVFAATQSTFTSEASRPNLLAGAAEVTASLVNERPSSWGGTLMAAYLLPAIPSRGFWIGPRAGMLWEAGPVSNHFDFQVGGEGIVWFVNALGAGFGTDMILNDPIHFRMEPFLALRILRFHSAGAWALRASIPYDTLYHWGFQVGVSLQLNGIPRLGSLE
jgi:hypothetical protein